MNNAAKSPRGGPKPLTERERMVLRLIAGTDKRIRRSLRLCTLAPSTVKRYVSSILWKLEVHTREEAVREADAAPIARDPTR